MEISNPHNLLERNDQPERHFGIRVTLIDSDPFSRLLPEQWERFHWFSDVTSRDEALSDMSSRHRYSRIGDSPTLRYEPVER